MPGGGREVERPNPESWLPVGRTAPSNTAMHRTNTALGFRVVEHMYEVEAPIA